MRNRIGIIMSAKRDGRSHHGFTLVELLVVVAIIGILAAIAVPVYLNQRVAAWKASVVSDVTNSRTAMESLMPGDTENATATLTGGVETAAFAEATPAEPTAETSGDVVSTLYDNASGDNGAFDVGSQRLAVSRGNSLYVQTDAKSGWYGITGTNVNVKGWKYVYDSSIGDGSWQQGDIDGGGDATPTKPSDCTTAGTDTAAPLASGLTTGLTATAPTAAESGATCAGANPFTHYFGTIADGKGSDLGFQYTMRISNDTDSPISDWSVKVDVSSAPFFGYLPIDANLTKNNLKRISSDTSSSITLTGTNTGTTSGLYGAAVVPAHGYTLVRIDMSDVNMQPNDAMKSYALAHETTTSSIAPNQSGASSIPVVNDSPYALPVNVKSADGKGVFSGTNPVAVMPKSTATTGWAGYTAD